MILTIVKFVFKESLIDFIKKDNLNFLDLIIEQK